VVECLPSMPSMWKALGSSTNTEKKREGVLIIVVAMVL
jgi:hypothetical protein